MSQRDDEHVGRQLASVDAKLATPTTPAPNWWWLTLFSAALVGTQYSWALQTSYASSLFLKMGASRSSLGLLRIPGPTTGLITQPVVGSLIDMDNERRRRRSRRRGTGEYAGNAINSGWPLSVVSLIFGSGSCALGLTLMALGYRVGLVHRDNGIIVASVGLWLTDFGFNFADVAMRAVTAAALPREHQALGNGFIASALGAGQVLGFAVGALPLAGWVESVFGVENACDFEGQVIAGVFVIIVTLACSLWTMSSRTSNGSNSLLEGGSASEDGAFDGKADVVAHGVDGDEDSDNDEMTPILDAGHRNGGHRRSKLLQVILDSYNLWSPDIPPKFYRIAFMTSIMYLAFFPSLYFTTGALLCSRSSLDIDLYRCAFVVSCAQSHLSHAIVPIRLKLIHIDFVATSVFGGVAANPDGTTSNDHNYDKGVRFANLFLGLNSLVITVCARTIIPMVPHLGYLWTFGGAGSLSLLAFLFSSLRRNQKLLAAVCITCFGIPFSIVSSLPYALISIYCRGEKKNNGRDVVGGLMGKVNLFIIGPSFLVWGCVYVLFPLGLTVRALIGSGCIVGVFAVMYGNAALGVLK